MKRMLWAGVLLDLLSPILVAQSAASIFSQTVLHEAEIRISPSDLAALAIDTENAYYSGSFTLDGIAVSNVALRQKGSGSRNPFKPSFKVDFNRYDDEQSYLGLKSLNLKSNVQDWSQLKHRVAMNLFARMGIPAPRQSHARLTVNGSYFGVYLLDEDIDKSFLSRVFHEKNGTLYEMHRYPPFHFEYRGPDPSAYIPDNFEPESPDDPDSSALLEMIAAATQSADGDFAAALSRWVDWKTFLAQLAVETYIGETDGIAGQLGMNNLYLYQLNKKTLFQFIPVDKDLTFYNRSASIFERFGENVLVRRAMADPDLLQIYLSALDRCASLAGSSGGWLQREFLSATDQIRASVNEDPNRQCDGLPCSDWHFEIQADFNARYAVERFDSVSAQLAELRFEAAPDAPGVRSGGVVDATTQAGVLTPGSYFTIFGERLAASTAADDTGPSSLAGVQVLINGFETPLTYVSPGQINGIVPPHVGAGALPLAVLSNGLSSRTISIQVAGAEHPAGRPARFVRSVKGNAAPRR
jgi:hypothetical protein